MVVGYFLMEFLEVLKHVMYLGKTSRNTFFFSHSMADACGSDVVCPLSSLDSDLSPFDTDLLLKDYGDNFAQPQGNYIPKNCYSCALTIGRPSEQLPHSEQEAA